MCYSVVMHPLIARIPRAELVRRLPRLFEEFSEEMAGRGLVPGVNVDRQYLPDTPEMPLPRPSIHDTITPCDTCTDDMWLGPEQLKRAQSGMLKVCYLCYMIVAAHSSSGPAHIYVLDPDHDSVPRRV